MFTPLRTLASEPEGKVLVASAAGMITFGTVVYTLLEGWSPVDALYFCVVTLATVGFGDLTPTSDVTKLFTVGYIITGIGIIAAFASELTKHRQATRPLAGPAKAVSSVAARIEEDVEKAEEHARPPHGTDEGGR